MRIDRAIKIVQNLIEINEKMIEEDDKKSDFSAFLKMQNKAFETLLDYVKRNLN